MLKNVMASLRGQREPVQPDESVAPDRAPRGRARRAAAAAAVLVMLSTAACSAGTAGQGTGDGTAPAASGPAAAKGKYLNFSPCCSWNTTWSYNPYNVNQLGIQNDLITLRLAIPKYPSMTEFVPQLAESWDEAPDKITVHLRKEAKWQDDKPLTSKDVVDTAYLGALRGDGYWNDITKVTAQDEHTVIFHLKKDQPVKLAVSDIIGNVMVYPSHVYGSVLTDELRKDVETYWAKNQTDPEGAGKLPEYKRISAAFQKLAAMKVDKLIGSGPFKLDNITTKEAKLTKWEGFWGADQVKVPGMNYMNGPNETIYPQLFGGTAEFSNVYLPPPILKRWQNTQGAKTALPLAFGFVMGFNSSRYPFDMKEVRQAIAYLIPRQQITEAAYGTDPQAGGKWKEVNTGISPSLEELYLNQEQLDQLNKYPVDPEKATKLLEGKGFTKKNGQWFTPKGKQFTITFTANSATSDIVTAFNSAASTLTEFGIKSEVRATSGAQQDADQHNGDFDMGMWFVGGNNPLGMYHAMMGPGNNFSTLGNYAGKRGMGFGPKVNLPGKGTVDVSSTIDKQLRVIPPDDSMKEATWQWAQLVNEEVPYIWYATKVYQFAYSEKNFTNWPAVDDKSTGELWDITSANMNAGVSLAIQQGHIVPK